MYAVSSLAWSTDGKFCLSFMLLRCLIETRERHATLSKLDATWMEEEMEKIFGKPGDQVSAEEFRAVRHQLPKVRHVSKRLSVLFLQRAAALVRGEATEGASGIDPSLTNGSESYADKVKSKLENHKPERKYPDPLSFTVPGLVRDPTTYKYNDDDLARILVNAIDEPAGAFKANHIPGVMRPIDVRGMESARKYGVCTMNEFRWVNFQGFITRGWGRADMDIDRQDLLWTKALRLFRRMGGRG